MLRYLFKSEKLKKSTNCLNNFFDQVQASELMPKNVGGFSKKDFVAKLQISYKEARETKYWLRILRDSNLLELKEAENLISDIDEILRILTAILNSSKTKTKEQEIIHS